MRQGAKQSDPRRSLTFPPEYDTLRDVWFSALKRGKVWKKIKPASGMKGTKVCL